MVQQMKDELQAKAEKSANVADVAYGKDTGSKRSQPSPQPPKTFWNVCGKESC